MEKGRKKTSNKLKQIKGTDQKCRMDQNENKNIPVLVKLPPPPKYFNKSSRNVYKTLGQTLSDAGIINGVTLLMFISFCHNYGIWYEYQVDFPGMDDRIETFYNKAGNKYTAPSTAYKISMDCYREAQRIAAEFGLTPNALKKLATITKEESDPYEDFKNEK